MGAFLLVLALGGPAGRAVWRADQVPLASLASDSTCRLVGLWVVRFTGSDPGQLVKWTRCGAAEPTWIDSETIDWPVDEVEVHAGASAGDSVVYVFSNEDEPAISGLVDVTPTDLDQDGKEELRLVTQVYGTGAIFEECTLAREGDAYRCWEMPDLRQAAGALLQSGEIFYKGPIPAVGFEGQVIDSLLAAPTPEGTLWYLIPIFHEGDPNCCSSAGADFWVEVGAARGRFEIRSLRRVPGQGGAKYDELWRP